MGVFDNINFEIACPACGEKVTDFQSKSGFPSGKTLEFWEVDEFHTPCRHCGAWPQYRLRTKKQRNIDDYELENRPLPERKDGLENRGTYPRLGDKRMFDPDSPHFIG